MLTVGLRVETAEGIAPGVTAEVSSPGGAGVAAGLATRLPNGAAAGLVDVPGVELEAAAPEAAPGAASLGFGVGVADNDGVAEVSAPGAELSGSEVSGAEVSAPGLSGVDPADPATGGGFSRGGARITVGATLMMGRTAIVMR